MNLFRATLLLAIALACTVPVAAQEKKPPFRWGGDKAGGAPFIYDEADKQVGFETELAEYFGKKLGREPIFVQADWDNLLKIVERGETGPAEFDVAMNGIEYSSDRAAQSTFPYFLYTLRLIVRKDSPIAVWEDLKPNAAGKKLKVGVLRDTFAERYIREQFGDRIEVVPTKEVVETFQLIEDGSRLDASVQDSPAAVYYIQGGKHPQLKVVGEPRAKNYYVIYTRQQDKELRESLNKAIREAVETGELERIYRKYNLWDVDQERLAYTLMRPWPPEVAERQEGTAGAKKTIFSMRFDIAEAFWMTVSLTMYAMPLAILAGLAIAVGRVYGPLYIRAPLSLYVEIVRGTPMLLQFYVLYFFVPKLLIGMTDWPWLIGELSEIPNFYYGVVGLAINYSAYESEIYRAGIQAIPRGQMEAALSLGMSRGSAVRRVIVPQAVRLVIPPVTNDFINMFKDTSICSMILITELTNLYYQNKSDRELSYQLALVIAVLYMLLSYPLSLLARQLENRLRRAMQ